MNREILFRGKRIDNGEWVEGYYFEVNEKHMIMNFTVQKNELYHNMYEIEPNTVCQFTGLTDKNGRKIWENDILSAHWDDDYPEDVAFCKVVWEENGFKTIESDSVDSCYLLKIDCDEYYEAIGNIYDNPKLLEVEHE